MIRPVILAAAVTATGVLAGPQRLPGEAGDGATRIHQLFAQAHARGAAVLLDVKTGRTIAAVGVGRDVTRPVLPLSIIKLYVAAIWWEAGLGEGDFSDLPPEYQSANSSSAPPNAVI